MNDLQTARALLESQGYTCVLCREGRIHTSRHRGVKPLMDLLDQDLTGFSAADKVVGKATALLYCLLGIRELYAAVISQAALEILRQHGIPVSWGQQVDYIVNREGTGRCPMELATEAISDPTEAPAAISRKLEELKSRA